MSQPLVTNCVKAMSSCLDRIYSRMGILPVGVVFAWVICPANLATAAVEYSVTDLGNFQCTAANNRGQVVGYSQAFPGGLGPNNDNYLSDNGKLIDLTRTFGVPGFPYGIGDGGQILGSCPITGDTSGVFHAFVFSGGKLTDLGSLGGNSIAGKINAAGQMIGTSNVSALDASFHAVIYTGGKVIDLGTLGGPQSFAYGINDSGQVVGSADTKSGHAHPFLYQNGQLTDLAPLGLGGFAADINNKGQIAIGEVVGKATGSGAEPATYSLIDLFVYQNGTMTDLGRLGDQTEPTFINSSGEIVGTYGFGATGSGRPFVYRDGRFQDLNSLIGSSQIRLYEPVGLNDAGQIVIRAQIDSFPVSRSDTVLLTPIPEPAAIWLLLPMAALARHRRSATCR